MCLMQVKNLTHVYSEGMPYETPALTDISFDIEPGQFVGIIGHTGSGKSTMVQHLNGLLKPKSGQILLDGVDMAEKNVKMRDIRRKVGLVFQYPEYQLFEETVHKDVAFGPLNLGLSQEEADERVREAIQLVGLDYEQICSRSPFELSGGQKRRVAIAGVIAMKPQVLILDEPTAGLDPKAHEDILNMIEKIHKDEKNAILLISHNMGDIAKLCDKVLVMDQGKLVLEGKPKEVFSQEDFLESLGLAVPPAAAFANKLKRKGIAINGNPLTVCQVEEELARLLGECK